MVAAVLGPLGVIVCRYSCAFISAIAACFFSNTDVMSTNMVGVKLHNSGWWGSNRNSAGGLIVAKALRTPAPAASTGAVHCAVCDRVIGVERVGVGVRDQQVGRELADLSAIRPQPVMPICNG